MTVGELIARFSTIDNEKHSKLLPEISKFPYQKGFLDNLAFSAVKFAARLLYKFEIKGVENLPKDGGFILCPNHETYFDSFWILMNLPKKYCEKICCMAKHEILAGNNPFKGTILRVGGIIPVDRNGNTIPAMKCCLEKLKESRIVLIHPEGTRSINGSMGVFKSGASKLSLDSNKPIVPVRIKGAYRIFPVGRPLPRLFDLRRLKRYKLEIIFGPPIEPVGADALSLTELLRDRILEL